jgi:hypothetical protein
MREMKKALRGATLSEIITLQKKKEKQGMNRIPVCGW